MATPLHHAAMVFLRNEEILLQAETAASQAATVHDLTEPEAGQVRAMETSGAARTETEIINL